MRKDIVHPRFWLRHRRVRRALVAYPLYDVPYKTREADLTEAQVRENFDYFMQVRHDRLAFFLGWLRIWFGVAASLTPEGVLAISSWIDDFGGGVVGDDIYSMTVFATYTPVWTRNLAGYNVMIDLGIFVGEYLIWRCPELYWEIYRGHNIEPETFGSIMYLKPVIGGMPKLWKSYPLRTGYGIIEQSRILSKITENHGHSKASALFLSKLKQNLYLSKLSNDSQIIGDSKHEPL